MKYSFLLLFICSTFLSAQNIPLYVGSYTDSEGEGEGIYRYYFNTETGELHDEVLLVKMVHPTFLDMSSNREYLYAMSEARSEVGAVNSFSINEDDSITFMNKVSSEGKGPCHVQLNESDNKLVVSNYSGGTIAVYNIDKNGEIEDAFQVIDHNIKDNKSHAHSAKFLKNNLFIADLGRDFLAQYVENNGKYNLKENFSMEVGAGPRHFEISKKGDYLYVINELNSTITALKKDKDTYINIQNISTLKDDYTGDNSCADIHLSKDENFLYGSNRGENSIVVFKRNSENGTLEKIQSISVEGDWPRNFTISPNGKFLLVANRRSNNISVYNIQKESGKLTYLNSVKAATPVCLLF